VKATDATNYLEMRQVPIGTMILLTVAALPLIYKSEFQLIVYFLFCLDKHPAHEIYW
jgi:hypothetical protein